MSNQELADWIHSNASELGIDVADGLAVRAIDEYRMYGRGVGWVTCEDALCGGSLEVAIYGHYDPKSNVIELFRPSFEPGTHVFALSDSRVVAYRGLSRAAIAVQSFGHEAGHSVGMDMVRDMAPIHFKAELHGLDAKKRFRRLYE